MLDRSALFLLGSASWWIAGACVWAYPAADSLALASAPISAWLFAAIGTLSYAPWIWFKPAKAESDARSRSLWAVPISLLLQCGLSLLAAGFVHRDYFTLIFQAICLHYIALLKIMPGLNSRAFFNHIEKLYHFTIGVIVFFLIWIAMMGYAIATRSEPRWIPSIAYNIYNLILCCVLYLSNLDLHRKSKRELSIVELRIRIDHLDITPLVNPMALPLALYLLSNQRSKPLTCRIAQPLLGDDGSQCDACSKATLCPRYKYLYNRIHELRRLFQALRLGVITNPANPQNVLEEGWRFEPDASITVVADRAKEAPSA